MLLRRNLTAVLIAAPLAIAGGAARAGEWDFSASLAGELRVFPYDAAFPEQKDSTLSPSVSVEPEVVYEWNGGDDRLSLVPFLRWDANDDNRTHGDLREANWLHIGDDWDLVVGVDKVFWGAAPPLPPSPTVSSNRASKSTRRWTAAAEASRPSRVKFNSLRYCAPSS